MFDIKQLTKFVQTNKALRKGVVDDNREINDLLKKLDQLK